jgi:hypothetical protein
MKSEETIIFHEGDLVEILVDRTFTSEGLATTHVCGIQGIALYKRINLDSYPSTKDFVGDNIICLKGQTATIIKSVGRPWAIKQSGQYWEYDVYEILVTGEQFQIFANNLKLLSRTKF